MKNPEKSRTRPIFTQPFYPGFVCFVLGPDIRQVSVYRTIGRLVLFFSHKHQDFSRPIKHFWRGQLFKENAL